MKFRTEILVKEFEKKIEHHHQIMTIGSCFAENISQLFEKFKFKVLGNPFGVIYNPVSVLNSLELVFSNNQITKSELFEFNDEWHSFYFHSDFSHHDAEKCFGNINLQLEKTRDFLKKADWIIITYGTAHVFKHLQKDIIVSNCHKIPANQFKNYRLTFDETRDEIHKTIEVLRRFNPNLKIIFTVSPVRHWKNGAHENQLSKSSLLLAIDEINEDNIFYFPSYELVMDDLRDYRFYAEDLLHPNNLAINYIWEKFSDSFFEKECLEILKKIEKISSACNHKVRNSGLQKHKEFIKTQLKNIEELEISLEYLDLTEEKEHFHKDLQ